MVSQDLLIQGSLIFVIAVAAILGYLYKKQLDWIAFYESQGGYVYPGARRPIIGYLPELLTYMRIRHSEQLVEMDHKWLYQNVDRFLGKKEEEWVKDKWRPVYVMYMIGLKNCTISCPRIVGDAKENQNIDKDSFLREHVFSSTLKDNVLTMHRCPEQTRRRRAMMHCFQGTSNFTILDKILKDCLPWYFNRWSASDTIDFREEMNLIFEEVIFTFLFGKDNFKKTQKMLVMQKDGSISEERQGGFDALFTAYNTGWCAVDNRLVFGEGKYSKSQCIAIDNWERLRQMVDGIVVERQEQFKKDKKNGIEKEPECLIDLLFLSDVYQDSIRKIANELIMGMLAANETSRNTSTVTICNLTKYPTYRSKVREEIKSCMTKYGISSAEELTHKHTTPSDLEFLSWTINETLRINPPIPITERFRIARDCKLGDYNFKKDEYVAFFMHGVHHNPNEWHQPEKYLPYRFDPQSPLFKTPDGKMRNPNSFIPFSFGERMCLGYKFAQVMLPTLVSKIVYNFDLEFEDKEFMKEDTHVIASVFQNHQTPINMRVKRTPEYAA